MSKVLLNINQNKGAYSDEKNLHSRSIFRKQRNKVLDNMREGMRLATKVFLLGYAPFCPWLDFHFQLMLREGETLTVEDYYRYSIAWLRVSDAMLLVPGWQSSKGTKAEMEIADKVGIPIYYDINNLKGVC